MRKMSKTIKESTIDTVQRVTDLKPINLKLLFRDYSQKDIAECADLISKMLQWVPADRISCEEALKHPVFKGLRDPVK